MKPTSLAIGIFTLGMAMLSPVCVSRANDDTPQKIVEYKERVPMNTGEIRRGDVCVTFYPDVEADDFFKGLQRIDHDRVSVFRRDDQLVTTYPSLLRIQIDIRISVCDADVYTPAPTPDILKTLHFKVQWKRQLELRPVANFAVQNVPINEGDGENRLLWVVQIRDHNVPLTDHLILTILSPDGKILSRMAARL